MTAKNTENNDSDRPMTASGKALFKNKEEALPESDEHYRNLFENNHAVMLLIDPDSAAIVDANHAACAYYGWSCEELKKMRIDEINTLTAKEVFAEMQSAKSEKRNHFFFRHRRADDTIRDVEVYSGPLTFKGEVLLYSIIHDITERRRAEEALLESEEKYRLTFNTSPDSVNLNRLEDGLYMDINDGFTKLTGFTREDVIGKTSLEINIWSDPADREKLVQGLREKGYYENLEARFRRKDGSIGTGLMSAKIISLNRIPYIISITRDITERKQAEKEKEKLQAQLNQAQKLEAIGQLAGGVAHDFNNMLNIILGYAQMALMKIEPSGPLYASIQEIMNAAQRSSDLVRQLLAFARKQTIAPKALDLNDTVAGVLNMLRKLIGENIDLLWMPAANLWPVKMDPAQIDQILANLAVNARDSISGVGKITIETGNAEFDESYCAQYTYCVPGQYVLLTVSDNGCGMDKETREKIFEPFFTTKEVGKGTGMGLATVYGIVKQNCGFINVDSEPGKGATFKIYLPRRKEEEGIAIDEPCAQARSLAGTETVLIVEDNEALLKMGKMMLEVLGYSVLSAGSPKEAIQLAGEYEGEIHLILTDVVMPKMSGRDLMKRLSELRPGIKCLFMSGYTANVIAHQGILDEGVHFLQKPFLMNDLAAGIREALEEA